MQSLATLDRTQPRRVKARASLSTETVRTYAYFGVVGLLILVENIQILGAVGLVAQAGLTFLMPILAPGMLRQLLLKWWPLLLLPIWAVASMIWSIDRVSTLRYALQLAVVCLAGLFIALRTPPRTFVAILFSATFVFCVLSVLSNRKGPAADGMVLVGLTGAKNQMSFAGQMLMSTALAMMFDNKQNILLRLSAPLAFLIGGVIVGITHAATGTLTAAGAVVLFLGLCGLRFVPKGMRGLMLVAAILGVLPVIALASQISSFSQEFLVHVLHKDSTLTGRTYLWSVADDLIKQRPALGFGYKAFWTTGREDAIGILRSAKVVDARGFGFQDTFRELAVDIGCIGLAMFVFTFLPATLNLGRRSVVRPDIPTFFLFTTATVFAIRSLTDMSVEPGFIYTTLIFSLYVYAWQGSGCSEAVLATESGASCSRRVMKQRPLWKTSEIVG